MTGDAVVRAEGGATTQPWPRLLAAYLCLVATSVLVNYPGRINSDTAYMLWQGQNIGELNDWHSPFATLVFSFLSPLFGSPCGALVAQSALLLTLPAVWFVRLSSGGVRFAQRMSNVLVWGVVTSTLVVLAGQIVKDVLGLCFLSLAVAIIEVRRESGDRRALWVLVSACLVGFVLERPTSLIPIVSAAMAYLVVCAQPRRRGVEIARTIAFVSVACLSILFVPPFLGAQKDHPESTPMVFDLAGISTILHEDMFAPVFLPTETRHAPWDCYTPRASDIFFWGTCHEYEALVRHHQSGLVAAWVRAIAAHPAAYLKHRAGFARELLLTYRSTSLVPVPPDFVSGVDNSAPGTTPPSEIMRDVKLWKPTISFVPFGRIAYFILAQTSMSRGLIWIITLLLLPLAAYWLKSAQVASEAVVLSTFGIVNALTMIFVGPAAEARYLLPTWWCLAVEVVAFASTPWCLPVVARRKRGSTPPLPVSRWPPAA